MALEIPERQDASVWACREQLPSITLRKCISRLLMNVYLLYEYFTLAKHLKRVVLLSTFKYQHCVYEVDDKAVFVLHFVPDIRIVSATE